MITINRGTESTSINCGTSFTVCLHARGPARPQHAAHPPSHTGVLTTRAALTLSSPKATNRPQPRRNRSDVQKIVRNFERKSRRTTVDNPGWRQQKQAKQDAAAQPILPPAFRSEGNDDMPINRPAQNPFVTPHAPSKLPCRSARSTCNLGR